MQRKIPSSLWETHYLGKTPLPLIAIGVLATLFYVFSKPHFGDFSDFNKLLLSLSGLISIKIYATPIWKHPVFHMLWWALLLAVCHWFYLTLTLSHLAGDYPKLDHIARLFVFIIFAWWLAGSTRNTLIFWSIASAAVILSPWIAGDGLADFQRGFHGERIGFDIRNVQHSAMFFGTVLLGLLIFIPRLLRAPLQHYGKLILWVVAFLIILAGVIISQTRATWLGVAAAMLTVFLLLFIEHRKRFSNKQLLLIFFLSTCLAILIISNSSLVIERATAELDTIQALLRGDWSSVPLSTSEVRSSVGERLYSWRAAIDMIAQRPLLGWGDQGVDYLFNNIQYNHAHYQALNFGHLHNLYLEITLQYGLLGLVAYFYLLIWFTKSAWLAWKRGDMPGDVLLFFYAFLCFWSVINLFESYLIFWTGVFLFNVVMAGCLTHIWKPELRANRSKAITHIEKDLP
ncbi:MULTISPECIES: O-antigen ligase family protein [unclassified Halomonas]|uniref:O-antigen ligase family protein n=1 Tax=unclassified Halomonas TaxID=2609666 RepID=UPI0009EECED3|nr:MULTISPECIES: O-antigen ligase family protein [unclassified Halomonas]MBT2787670.1 O-antigen ligase family protein [Halomonas sp. ISL-106]MBT2798947.1 O-antigen ligase family protein [Halomonas sp. ISL-104]